jgi:hypothetical protein
MGCQRTSGAASPYFLVGFRGGGAMIELLLFGFCVLLLPIVVVAAALKLAAFALFLPFRVLGLALRLATGVVGLVFKILFGALGVVGVVLFALMLPLLPLLLLGAGLVAAVKTIAGGTSLQPA